MIINVHRKCADGKTVKCYIRSESINAIELSERDNKTTVVRTNYGCIAVTEPCEDMVRLWQSAIKEAKND